MTNQQEKWLILGAAVIVAIVGMILLFLMILGMRRTKAVDENARLRAIINQEISYRYLPLVMSNAGPTEREIGDIYAVVLVDADDVATFVNKEKDNVIKRARCVDPGWPTPEVGTLYRLDQEGVFNPVINNTDNNLQRFVVLDE